MKVKLYIMVIMLVVFSSIVNADIGFKDVGLPKIEYIPESTVSIGEVNYSGVNVNNSQWLNGYNWTSNPWFPYWYNHTLTANATIYEQYGKWFYNMSDGSGGGNGWLPNNVTEYNNYTTTGNLTSNYGFFGYLGKLATRITKLWVTDIDATYINVPMINTSYIDYGSGYGINNTASGICIGYQANCFT